MTNESSQTRLGFALALLTLSVASFAQRVTSPMGLTGKIMLVSMKEVKKEIHFTGEQDKKLQAAMKDMQNNPAAMGMPDMHYMTRGMDAKLVEILDVAQNKRLEELFLQFNGPLALSEKEVVEQLALSDDVMAKAKDIIKQHDKDAMSVLMGSQKAKSFDSKKMEELDKQANEQLLALLTPMQLDSWKSMQGEPFKFPKSGR